MLKPTAFRPTRVSRHATEVAASTSKRAAKAAATIATAGSQPTTQPAAKTATKGRVTAVSHAAAKSGTATVPLSRAPGGLKDRSAEHLLKQRYAGKAFVAEQTGRLARGGGGAGAAEPSVSFGAADEAAVIAAIKPAIKKAVESWKALAYYSDISINGPVAVGAPGCLNGPVLEPLIRAELTPAGLSGAAKQMSEAVAEAFSDGFLLWQDHVTVPSAPWYPAFAAFPGPHAPPMPNVPWLLSLCVSSKTTKLVLASEFATTITQAAPAALQGETSFINRVASGIALAFAAWLGSVKVEGVNGFGPVPSFAPPYVPVGPVVGGSVLEVPGVFLDEPQLVPLIA